MLQVLSKRQHRAPNAHKMLTNLGNARFPGPMSWKKPYGRETPIPHKCPVLSTNSCKGHRKQWVPRAFSFDALDIYILILMGILFDALNFFCSLTHPLNYWWEISRSCPINIMKCNCPLVTTAILQFSGWWNYIPWSLHPMFCWCRQTILEAATRTREEEHAQGVGRWRQHV